MNVVLTVGYEGARLDDFVATLQEVMVDVLIDIRDVPVSRKRGFSKRALSDALRAVDIDYIHMRKLGDPRPGREAARRGDIEEFQRIFRSHLAENSTQEALQEAVEIAQSARACLLCYERQHACCHRSIVAEAMAEREEFGVRHIGIRAGLASERNRPHELISGSVR